MTRSALALQTNDEEDEAAYSAYREAPLFRSALRAKEGATPSASNNISSDLFTRRTLQVVPKAREIAFTRSFQMLQQWTGQVKQVTTDSFVAIISDTTNPNKPDEEVELELEEVAPDDMRLVRPGSLFYWAVGYEDGIGVPRQRVSRIRFRRLPGITSRDIARARDTAKRLDALFA